MAGVMTFSCLCYTLYMHCSTSSFVRYTTTTHTRTHRTNWSGRVLSLIRQTNAVEKRRDGPVSLIHSSENEAPRRSVRMRGCGVVGEKMWPSGDDRHIRRIC